MKSASCGPPCCVNFAISEKRVAGTVSVFVTWKSQEFYLSWVQKLPRHRWWFEIHIQYWYFPVRTTYI